MQNSLKRMLLIAGGALAWMSQTPAHAIQYHVILMGGQSNMDGHTPAATSEITNSAWANPQANVLYNNANGVSGAATASYYTGNTLQSLQPGKPVSGNPNTGANAFGPEVTLGWKLAQDNPSNHYIIIKYAVTGTNLYGQWNASNGNIYSAFRTAVGNALQLITNGGNTYQIDGMAWLQGEADSGNQTQADAYQTNITNFIQSIRSHYGANLPFVMGGIGDGGTSGTPYRSTVQAAQSAVSSAEYSFNNATIVDSKSANPTGSQATDYTSLLHSTGSALTNVVYFSNNDLDVGLHFNTYGQEVIGQRFATAFETLVPEPASLSGLVLAGGIMLRRSRRGGKR